MNDNVHHAVPIVTPYVVREMDRPVHRVVTWLPLNCSGTPSLRGRLSGVWLTMLSEYTTDSDVKYTRQPRTSQRAVRAGQVSTVHTATARTSRGQELESTAYTPFAAPSAIVLGQSEWERSRGSSPASPMHTAADRG